MKYSNINHKKLIVFILCTDAINLYITIFRSINITYLYNYNLLFKLKNFFYHLKR